MSYYKEVSKLRLAHLCQIEEAARKLVEALTRPDLRGEWDVAIHDLWMALHPVDHACPSVEGAEIVEQLKQEIDAFKQEIDAFKAEKVEIQTAVRDLERAKNEACTQVNELRFAAAMHLSTSFDRPDIINADAHFIERRGLEANRLREVLDALLYDIEGMEMGVDGLDGVSRIVRNYRSGRALVPRGGV